MNIACTLTLLSLSHTTSTTNIITTTNAYTYPHPFFDSALWR